MNKRKHYDILVIGSGAAGLGLVLSLADDYQIALISKGDLIDGSSPRAQGGIAAVMNAQDSVESHIQDTINAGGGLCNPETVEFTIKNGRNAIQWLIDHGVKFTTEINAANTAHLTQEGGHSQRRILHVADKTGAAVVQTLAEQVALHPNIDCYVHQTAIDLIIEDQQCLGAWLFNNSTKQCYAMLAKKTVLATGGASRCYLHTSNSNLSSGDGIAMAYRAGARVANLEFNQFHPTTLYHPNAESYLISEVLRGEGGILKLPNGERFLDAYDSRAELAPRDIVSRAIDSELKKHNINHVLLDISHLPATEIKRMFPTIYSRCLQFDIDITSTPIPVVPAAHYTCGGVMTDLEARTDIDQLYAIGEVAYTGFHGANRMASNSLLECLVFAMSAGKHIKKTIATVPARVDKPYPYIRSQQKQNRLNIDELTQHIRKTLWDYVGIVRSNKRLAHAHALVSADQAEIESAYHHNPLSRQLIECRNIALLARLIIECAMRRKESRGLHYNIDHPKLIDQATDTILVPAVLNPNVL